MAPGAGRWHRGCGARASAASTWWCSPTDTATIPGARRPWRGRCRWTCGWAAGTAGDTVETGGAPWLRPGPARRLLHRWRDWTLEALDPVAVAKGPLHENDRSLVLVLRRGPAAAMVW